MLLTSPSTDLVILTMRSEVCGSVAVMGEFSRDNEIERREHFARNMVSQYNPATVRLSKGRRRSDRGTKDNAPRCDIRIQRLQRGKESMRGTEVLFTIRLSKM